MNKPDRNYLFIFLVGALLYVPFLGRVHLFDWDEINFAEAAREMIVTGNYLKVQINFLPFWEKPPLFIWLEVISMKIFGVNEFAARFPNAIVGIITLMVIYTIGKTLFNKRLGQWWALAYAGSILPQFYFKSGIIDPTFNLFIFTSVYFLYRFIELKKENGVSSKGLKWGMFSGLFIGLAVLTKGPVALIVLFLCWLVFQIIHWNKIKHWHKEYLYFILVTIIVSGSWFVLIGMSEGWGLLGQFIQYQYRLLTTQDSGHGGPFYYHFLILLVGCFPASLALFMVRINKTEESHKQQQFRLWMTILLCVTLILFSFVRTKIVHYSSLCYFPLSFIAAFILSQPKENLLGKKLSALMIALIGIFFSLALISLPFVGNHIQQLIPYVHDKFAQGNMQAVVGWHYGLAFIGLIFLFSVIVGVWCLIKGKVQSAFITLFTGTIVMVQLTSYFIVPRIEQYSEAAAIDFYQLKAREDCYVEVYGFKSYAYLFYSNKRVQANPNNTNLDWLIKGNVDKPVYIVGEISSESELNGYSTLTKIGEKNGFVFYKRK